MQFGLPFKYFILLRRFGNTDKRSKEEANLIFQFTSFKRQSKFGMVS